MARNVVPLGAGRVALIDFQDLRPGPAAYDLASMLNDSLFPPEPMERGLVERYLPPGTTVESYGRAVAQRTLKAVGNFVAFAARGEPRHRPLIAPALARAERHLRLLPETRGSVRAAG